MSCHRTCRYDYYTGDRLIESVGNSTTVMTGIYHINMFVRSGTVFVTQVFIIFTVTTVN